MKNLRKNQTHIGSIAEKGFTLVELLIVVIILAILAAIVVPQFGASTNDARNSAADSTLAGLRAAIDLYFQQHGEYPGANTAVPTAVCAGTSSAGAANTNVAVMQQLARYTDSEGGACSVSDANHRYGPYLKKVAYPSDPYSTNSVLEVVAVGDLLMNANGADPGGFKYDALTGKIIINIIAQQNR